MLFHRHKWTITGSSYTAPIDSFKIGSVEGRDAVNEMQRQMNVARTGETHIYLRCSECGDVTSRSVPGRHPIVTDVQETAGAQGIDNG